MKHTPESLPKTESKEDKPISDELFYKTQGLVLSELLGTENGVLEKWLAVPGNADVSRALVYEYLEMTNGMELDEEQVKIASNDLLKRLGGSVTEQ